MERKKRKKRALTLMEIMIVIFLIGLVAGVVGYNMRGSLEKGKKFKTERGMEKVKDILLLQIAEGADPERVAKNPAHYLKQSGLVDDVDSLLKDGWGKPYNFKLTADYGIEVTSEKYQEITGAKNKAPVENADEVE